MGLDASAQAAIASAVIAVAAWLVSAAQLWLTRRWRRQDRRNILHDRQQDQLAAEQLRRQDQAAASATRQQDRQAALLEQYTTAVQPAVTMLLALKQQVADDGALWPALMALGKPTTAAMAQPVQPPQLVMPGDVATAEHKARNVAKHFWEGLVTAMEQHAVPPLAFGTAVPTDYGAVEFAGSEDGDRWRERANNFRELVEPFDIVNWYRSGLFDRTGRHYTKGTIRPTIFQRLEDMTLRHLRAQHGPTAHLTYRNSMVWAHAQAGTIPDGSGWAPLVGGPQAHPPLRDAPVP